MTVSRGKAAIALRYALAPACIGAAVLLRVSPLGPFFYPTEPFILGVLAAAWFGGVGPGVFAALLSAVTVPQLIALTQLPSTEYRLLWGFFDLPRFIPLGLTGAAVGWGASSIRRTAKALRERQRELSKTRDELEAAVAERTAHLAASEEALRDSQQRYERVMLASNPGIWDWDVVKDEFYVSPRFLEMGGLPPDTVFSGREDFMRRGPLHPEDREKWKQAVRQLFASGASRLSMELRALVNGETRWRRLEGICFRDAAGRVVRWTGSTTDITERKHAEEALRRSEERFSLAMEATEEGHYDVDVDTGQLFTSERMNEIYGFAPGTQFEKRRDYLRQFRFYGNDAETYHAAIAAAEAKGGPERYEFEYRMLRPSGEMRWLRTRGKVTRDAEGRARRRTGVVADITEAKLAQEALLQSQERYALAMEAAADGHTDWNLVTGEFYISPRLLRILGYAQDTTFADRADWVRRFPFHPEDRPRWESAIAAHFAGRDGKFRMDLRIVVRGETRWVAFTFIANRDPAGKPVRWTGTITDIHDAKLAEEALRRSEERYARVMEASRDGVWDWDLVKDEYYVSPRLLELSGLPPGAKFASREEYMRQHSPLHPDDRDKWQQAVRQLFASDESRLTMVLRSIVKGETQWHRLTGICQRDTTGRVVRWTGSTLDLTETKRVEEALQQSEDRYSRAMTAANAGFWDWHLAKDEFYVSPRLLEMTGFAPGTTFASRADFMQRTPFHPDDREAWQRAVKALFAGAGSRLAMELRVIVDGRTDWQRLEGMCFRDAEGKVVRWTGSATSVTARKLAEERLRESEERYALAVDGSNDGIWDWDLLTNKMFVSERAQLIFGLEPGPTERLREEWHGMIEFHPEDHLAQRRMVEDYLAGVRSSNEGEWRVRSKDGGYRWIRIRSICLRNPAGEPVRMAGSVSDIDAQKRAEEALRASEERYALAVAGSDDGVWDLDFDAGRVFISPRARELAGMPPGPEILSMEEWAAALPVHPEDAPLRAAAMQAHLKGETPAYVGEFRLRQADGSYRWRRLHGLCLRNAHGKPHRMAGSIADVDARRRAEEALRLSEARYALAMEVAEEGHFDWNVQTDEIFASAQGLRVIGLPPDAEYRTRGEVMSHVSYHPDDVLRISNEWRAALAGKALEHEFEYRILRGAEPRSIRGRWKVFRDESGAALRVIGVVADITPRKIAEEARRLSEERYALAMEASEEGHFDWNVQTDEIFASASMKKLLGLPADAEYRTRADMVARVHYYPGDLQRLEEMNHRVVESDAQQNEFEYRILRGGEVRWVRRSWKIIRDAAGAALRVIGVLSDFTERKLAEEALRRSEAALRLSEERYALALEASEEGHFDNDLETGEIFVSARVNEIYGFPRQARTLNRIEFLNQIPFHPDDRHVPAELSRQDWQDPAGDLHEIECRIVPRPGETRWIHSRAKIVRDAEGRARRRVGVVADITDRKLAEEALRRSEHALRLSEERYALALEASEEGHFDTELETGEMFVSARLNEIYGFARHAQTANRIEFLKQIPFHPDDRHLLDDLIRPAWEDPARDFHEFAASDSYEFECRIIPRPGEIRWIHTRGKVTRDAEGRARRRVGVVADITDRKLAEKALGLSEERYAYAMEAAQDAHWDWIIGTDQYYTSPRVVDVFGLPPGTTFTSRQDYLAKTPLVKEDLDAWLRAARELIAGTGSRLCMELRAIINGEVHWIQHNGLCVRDPSGRAVRWCGSVRDVTERRRAEEALRQSEERYALAVEGSNEGIFDWDLVSDRVYVSSRAQELFGLPRGELWRPRRDWRHILTFHPDDAPRLHDSIKAHIEGGTPTYDEEFRIVLSGGGVRWFRQRGIAMRDASGKAYRVVGSIGDITERKRAADTLRESESRFRTLVELNSGGFWEQDENLRYTPSAFPQDITGYPTDDRVGKTRWELCGNLTPLSSSWAEHQAVLAARQPFRDFEYRRLRPDGEIGYYSASGAPIFDGQGRFKGYYGVANDITERKRFEEELRSRQEMLDLAQKSARAIAFEWKIGEGEGENRWSPDLEAMYGFQPGTYDGSFETWKKLVHPEDWPAVKEAILHAHRTGDVASEYRAVHPDGSVHWLQAKGRMLFDAAGSPARMVGFMQDITQRKQAEEELRKMEQELRRAQRLEAMGTLAGGIAHDFNNILGAILGYGEMAMRDAKKGTRLHRDVDAIMAAGERGRSLVDRILAFSRSGVGERVPVHVEEVVREALDQLAAKLPESVTIMPRLRAGRAAMLGDSTQVHQVVMNLGNNAVQAMPEGGVLRVSLDTLRIEAPRASLIGKLSAGEHIVLKVADSGTGIRPEVLERMFDPFFTTKEVGVGSGLGLSLVHGIVATVAGAIDVATELGKGTTFTVYLPRSGDAPAKAADESRPLPRGEGERVLVVDDEEPLVRLATETLESLGYAPVGFTSSVNALQEFGANPGRFDAILTDERMPEVTGSAIIREVRRINPSIPILLMTGFVGGAAALKARELGANDVLKKPLLARELATSLARVLRP